jgi:hypothetical protein
MTLKYVYTRRGQVSNRAGARRRGTEMQEMNINSNHIIFLNMNFVANDYVQWKIKFLAGFFVCILLNFLFCIILENSNTYNQGSQSYNTVNPR